MSTSISSVGSVLSFATTSDPAAVVDGENNVIGEVIVNTYFNGAFNRQDTVAMARGFHRDFAIFSANGEGLERYPIQNWIDSVNARKVALDFDATTAQRDCRIVLTGPMIDLAGAAGSRFARLSAQFMRLAGFGNSYVPGGGGTPINTLPFAGNRLTSDPVRYARTAAIIEADASLAIGSPTVAWVDSAFRAMNEFADESYAGRLRQPLLLVAAGQDQVVSTPATGAFAVRLRAGAHLVIPGARHELLMEQDRYREQFWAAFDAFVPGSPLF